MQNNQKSLYRLGLLIVAGALFLFILLIVARSQRDISEEQSIPLPFGVEGSTVLRGAILSMGIKGGRSISQISFDNFESSEILPENNMSIILIPNASDISHGFPLSSALTSGKRIFGYKYYSRDGVVEIAAKVRAENGEPLMYSELFPGQFFASSEERSDNTFITDFSSQKNISFLSLAEVTLEKNARYIVITRDPNTVFTARGLIDVQTAQDVPGMLTGFVTGNVARTYNTGGSGKVYTTIYYDWRSGINISSGYMSIDENVDHFEEDNPATTGQPAYALLESRNNYGNNKTLYQSSFTFSGVPSNTTMITAARIRIAGSLFADMPETSRVKLTGTDGTDLTEWTNFPMLSSSNAIHTISFSLLPNITADHWQSVRMVFENQWASCGAELCPPYKQTMIRLQAIDARFDVECNGTCEYTPPECGNGIIEGYLFEVCDDKNAVNTDKCDNECKPTGNWWIDPETNIPEPGIPGPILRFDSNAMAMGKRLALPSGKVVQLWYSGRATSATTNERLYISLYEPGIGWGNIVTLNEGLGSVQAYGEQQVWFVIDNQERITVFFNVEGGTYRTTYQSGTWTQPILFSAQAITIAAQQIELDRRGIIVYTKLVPISQDLRSNPFFGELLSSYQWDDGLFAQKYNNGTWETSTMLKTLYHTQLWQTTVRQNPQGNNVPRSTPAITSSSGTGYTIRWYNEDHVVPVP